MEAENKGPSQNQKAPHWKQTLSVLEHFSMELKNNPGMGKIWAVLIMQC